jgi:hypothetical protein
MVGRGGFQRTTPAESVYEALALAMQLIFLLQKFCMLPDDRYR